MLLTNLFNSSFSVQKDLVTFIPAILFSKVAFTSPIVTLLFIKAIFILSFLAIANQIINGNIANIISVRGIFISISIKNEPTNITIEMNKSSGPWCASSVISIKSFTILDIVTPDLLLSKYVFGSLCKCVNTSFLISACISTPITCPQYCIK